MMKKTILAAVGALAAVAAVSAYAAGGGLRLGPASHTQ
jgi:hypothetical protein